MTRIYGGDLDIVEDERTITIAGIVYAKDLFKTFGDCSHDRPWIKMVARSDGVVSLIQPCAEISRQFDEILAASSEKPPL